MNYIKSIAFIFTLFLSISTINADADNFQNHPGDAIDVIYENTFYTMGWTDVSTHGWGYTSSTNIVISEYLDTKQMRFLVSGTSADSFAIAAALSQFQDDPITYISFRAVTNPYRTGSTYYPRIIFTFYSYNGTSQGSTNNIVAWVTADSHVELIKSGNSFGVFVDGVYKGDSGGSFGADLHSVKMEMAMLGAYSGAGYNWVLDDITFTNENVMGSVPHDWYILRNLASPASNGLYNELDVRAYTDAMHTSFLYRNVTSLTARNDRAKIVTKHLTTGTTVNTTDTLLNSVGTVTYNFTEMLMNDNSDDDLFGVYVQELRRLDNTLLGTDTFFYTYSASSGGSVSFDRYLYSVGGSGTITYSLVVPNFIDYNYYAYLYKLSDLSLVDTEELFSSSGTYDIDFEDYVVGDYVIVLNRKDADGMGGIDFAYDLMEVEDVVSLYGLTYDAENGIILNSTYVNVSQSASWFNTTSSSTTAAYTLTSLVNSVALTMNASKTNFTHEAFSVTPPTTYSYEVDLYLFPTNRTLNGTSIVEGMAVDYPWQQGVGTATVNIYNATWSNTTTSNAFGYYQFNLSELENGTYTVNATKTGYTNSSEYTVTVLKNSSSVKNIVLSKNYVLTIKARDTTSGAYISSFSATVDGTELSVTDGDATFSLSYNIYTVTVALSGYYSGSQNVFVNGDKNVTIDLSQTESPYYDQKHYVKFTVQSIWGTKYQNVDTTVYNGSSTTALLTGSTGSDGSVTFELDENVQYRFTFINLSQGISESRTLYPVDNHYYIIVSSIFDSWNTYTVPISDGIDFTISKEIINSTHAYINFSYVDHLTQTTSLTVDLNQPTDGDYFNLTTLDSYSGAENSSDSFIVEDYAGQSYLVHLQATHTTYGLIDSTYSISFSDDIGGKFPGIPASVWLYGAIFMLLFVGGIWTASNVERGSLVTVVLFFVLYGLGCFATLPAGTRTAMLAGGVLGFIIAVLMNLNKSNKDEGFQ